MWKDYLSFNKRQRNGILVLLSLIVLMMGWLIIANYIPPTTGDTDFTQFKHEVASSKSVLSQPDKHISTDSTGNLSGNQKPEGFRDKKVSINRCSVKELCHNPLINYYLAQAIVNYRELHGPYKKLEDLHNNKAIDDSTYSKIVPYLSIE